MLHDGPDTRNEDLGSSNDCVGQERLPIGPIESVLIRGRGTNRAVSAESVGLILSQLTPPWPNAEAQADLQPAMVARSG